jgi:spermidine synthase
MGLEGFAGQAAYVGIFGALFLPFLCGGVLISTVFEAHHDEFAKYYAIDLVAAAAGCVVAVSLLDHVKAPVAMLVIAAFAGLAAPLFYASTGDRKRASAMAVGIVVTFAMIGLVTKDSALFRTTVIRNIPVGDLAADRWNDFSRVIVRKGPFYTWGLSARYEGKHGPQYDLLIEGVAGTQIQQFDGKNIDDLKFFEWDIASLPHLIKPTGSTLVLGVGAGFDVMMAKHFHKAPIVGVEVNPLVGDIVNNQFGDYSGRPYFLPDVTINYENARTYVKRDRTLYDVVTVTWVDSGAATGAGAFALTENYLYTVEAFKDYLARLKDDGVLTFMRARQSPEYDAIKGIGIAVEALRQLGITEPEKHIIVSSVKSPHFGWRELTHVMMSKKPFTAEQIRTLDETRARLWFGNSYTPGRPDNDPVIQRLVVDKDRAATYASFPFDMEPTTDDRPFYFFLRALGDKPAGADVLVLRKSISTIFVLIAAFLALPLVMLLKRRRAEGTGGLAAPSAYFALLGLGFMLVEMKLLQQSVLIVGNPTLSLAAVLASLLLSTGLGALFSERISKSPERRKLGGIVFAVLLVALLVALGTSETIATKLTAFPLPVRTAGLVLVIAPLGFLLGCPLPIGMSTLGGEKGLVAWSWGINGMFGVAGTAVATYVAIHYGLARAFLLGASCYVVAALVFLFALTQRQALAPVVVADGNSEP